MNKLDARKEIKNRLSKLSEQEKEWASGCICDYLSELDVYKKAKSVFIYLASSTEPDTEGIVGLSLGLEKVVAVPKVFGDVMSAMSITPYTNFRKNKWGILEPEKGQILNDFDFIVVPMVAFDGVNRLGHGKGYYDKYLGNTSAYKVGVAFDVQEIKGLEVEKHDIPLDMVVTEKRVFVKNKVNKNKYFGE